LSGPVFKRAGHLCFKVEDVIGAAKGKDVK